MDGGAKDNGQGSQKNSKHIESHARRYVREAGIDIGFGKETWRPVQSVIDLVQNHLDAHTTVYEKKLLATVGITEYKPKDATQQQIVTLLNSLKYASTPEEITDISSSLQRTLGGSGKIVESLPDKLAEVDYQLPNVQLKVSDGNKSQLVDYNAVNGLSTDWQIVGLRITDQGSGFDNRLLGIMGGTLKGESSSKRGGLGEGLKMSVAHLVRSGATVRLLSRNGDELWTARPKIEDGDLNFHGVARKETGPHTTGSITDVNFARGQFDPQAHETIIAAIDPRIGEGLGKYVLEFKDPNFIPLINSSSELDSRGVTSNRVYVKGLLVEERNDLLWSYNLADKWAISGADRKTVHAHILKRDIEKVITTLDNPTQILKVVQLIGDVRSFMETQVLARHLDIHEKHKELWREAIVQTYQFVPGETLFIGSNVSTNQQRYAQERGYRLITIPSHNIETLNLITDLYPDHAVTLQQLLAKDTDPSKAGGEPLEPEAAQIVDTCRGIFTQLIEDYQEHPLLIDIKRVKDIRFFKAPDDMKFESPNTRFVYNVEHNIVYVRGDITEADFETTGDLSVQLLKAATRKDVFDTVTQDLLTKLAGDTILRFNPELSTFAFDTANFVEPEENRGSHYTAAQQKEDKDIIAFAQHLTLLDKPNMTRTELETMLEQLRKVKPADLPNLYDTHEASRYYYFDGKRYELDLNNLTLAEAVRMRAVETSSTTLQAQNQQVLPDHYGYLPYALQDNESLTLVFTLNNQETRLTIKRQGDTITAKGSMPSNPNVILAKQDEWQTSQGIRIALLENAIEIFPNTDMCSMTIEQGNGRQITEINQGKEFIPTRIKTDYRQNVWRDPKRILLDAIQNHLDAKKDAIPTITYTIINEMTGVVEEVSQEALIQNKDAVIIGMRIADNGTGYTTPYITGLGKSSKSDEDRGKFGEGLKMLAASAVNQGLGIEIGSRDWVARPTSFSETVKDYETGKDEEFKLLGYNMEWLDSPRSGSYTYFSLLPNSYTQTAQSTSSLLKKALGFFNRSQKQTSNYTSVIDAYNDIVYKRGEAVETWKAWLDILDPRIVDDKGRRGLERYVLPEREKSPGTIVTVISDSPNTIFERDLLIPGGSHDSSTPFMFGYNVDATLINTRERNDYDEWILNRYLSDFFKNLTDKDIMKKILATAKENPDSKYREYQILKNCVPTAKSKAMWRQAYYELFGEDAVLSLRSLIGNLGPFNYLSPDVPEVVDIIEAAVNEVHLENANLQRFPVDLTNFLLTKGKLYTSYDAIDPIKYPDVTISEEEQERLFDFTQMANQSMLTILESLTSDKSSNKFLSDSIPYLKFRPFKLNDMPAHNLRVKPRSWTARGRVTSDDDSNPIIFYNAQELGYLRGLVETHVHEVGHFLSGKKDYEIAFQKFLMAIVLSRIQFAGN